MCEVLEELLFISHAEYYNHWSNGTLAVRQEPVYNLLSDSTGTLRQKKKPTLHTLGLVGVSVSNTH